MVSVWLIRSQVKAPLSVTLLASHAKVYVPSAYTVNVISELVPEVNVYEGRVSTSPPGSSGSSPGSSVPGSSSSTKVNVP